MEATPKRTINRESLAVQAFCNSVKLPETVNLGGRRLRWVGIGWVDEGEATASDVVVTGGGSEGQA
jgi:hypothetical protein